MSDSKKIDEQFVRREVRAQRALADSAIKFSDRKKATDRAEYLVSLLKSVRE